MKSRSSFSDEHDPEKWATVPDPNRANAERPYLAVKQVQDVSQAGRRRSSCRPKSAARRRTRSAFQRRSFVQIIGA
jgi:hypothetical protein